MARCDPTACTVVLLENVPLLFSKNTDKQTIQKALIEYGYHMKLTNIMSVSYVGGEGERSGALYKLYGMKKDVTGLESVKLLCHRTQFNSVTIELNTSMMSKAFSEAKSGYQHLTFKETGGSKVIISGPSASVDAFCAFLDERGAKLLLSASVVPAEETIDDSVHAASAMPLTTVAQSVYDNMSPDALALLEKLPIGQIEGVYYDSRAGRVLIDKETPEKEDKRITKFQTAYQSIVSKKVKSIEVPIPATVSPDALANLVHQYNKTYDLCVFSVQEGECPCVKIVSTSSRQHDQARTLLADELVKMVSPTLPAASKCEIIHLSETRTLTLKKANIVEEVVDIIVNPANVRLSHGGGVAAALDKASKGQLQKLSKRHVENKGTVSVGSIAITSGGGALKCDKVIHAVGPDTRYNEAECERLLTKVINEALKAAERHNANSIAFPAISTGIFGVRKELVARCLVDTIMAHHFTKPHPVLSDIRIVIIDEPTYAPFARYFQQKQKKEHRPLIQPAKLTLQSPPTASGTEKGKKAPEENSTPSSKTPDKRLSLLNDSAKIEALLRGMAKDWRSLGTQLLFSKEALHQIASVPGHATIHLNKLLNKWLLGDGASPTISVLVNALYSMKGKDKYVESILKAYDDQQHVDVTPATLTDELANIKYQKEDNDTVNGSESDKTDQLPKENEDTFLTPASSPGSSEVENKTDQSVPLISASSSPPLRSTTNSASTASTVPVPLSPSPATPTPPPPGLPSPAPAHSTLGGYNNGQPWGYMFGQDGVLFPSGIGVWNVPQAPRPPNQPWPRGVTPHLFAQRSPYPGDGMVNPQHGEGGPRPAGVGTFNGGNGGNGATGMNFSQAVSGSGHDIAVTAQPHSSTHQTGQDNSGTKNSEGASKTKEESDECPICLSGFKDPVKTKCGHMFCRGCIDKAILHSSFCPICKTALRTIVGDQPIGGQMHVKYSRSKLPGYYDCGTIEITYYIPSGVQGNENPRPGHRYQGATRTAYLPNNFEGNEVLQLLKRAFDARLIFTVGTSVSSGQTDVVTWNDVHHKTSTHGGPEQYGYPDPTYFERVKADLAAKGIVTDYSTV